MTITEIKERYESTMKALKSERANREETFNRFPALSNSKYRTNFTACKSIIAKEKEVFNWYLREMEKTFL